MKRSLPLVAVFFFSLLLASFFVGFSVNEPSQQSNKIYYAPYYVSSMTQNVNTTFNLPINPPDGISEVKSAVLNFQVYGAPTITFTLYANNKSCNPASFSIATTYASTGLLSFAFDCSNVIKTAGNYTLKMAPSKTTGATYGWMDFVYVNRPNGQAEVKGTEYFAGDRGTVFLQLVDAYGQPINSAACFADIYYPNSYDNNHTAFVAGVPMLYKEEGLYYYDFTVPPYTGVYMVLASCKYGHISRFYSTEDTLVYPVMTVNTGTMSGSSAVLNSYSDVQYVKLDVVTQKTDVNVTFNNVSASNSTTVSFGAFFQTQNVGTITGSAWNFTSGKFVPIATFATTGTAGTAPVPYDDYYGITIPHQPDLLQNGTVILRINSSAGTGIVYYNALWLNYYNFDPQYVPIYGSGELHISSEASTPFLVSTLCGDGTSNCARFFQNDTNYPFPEGSVYDNVTVFAQETKDSYWTYSTPTEIDCSALNRIIFKNATNGTWTEIPFTDLQQYTTSTKNCILQIPINATRGTTYYYYLEYGNYMKYAVLDDWRAVNKLNSTMSFVCDPIASANNWTFVAPIPSSMTLPTGNTEPNVTLALCSRLKDGIYWSGYFYNQSSYVSDAGNYQQYLTELEYYYEKVFRGVTALLQINSVNLLLNVNNTLFQNISEEILNVNASIHHSLALNISQLTTGQTQILANLSSVNSSIQTVSNKIDLLSSALNFMNSTIHSAFVGNFTQAFNTLFDIKTEISVANQSVHTAIGNNFTNTNALIISTNNTPTVDFTPVLSAIGSTNESLHGAIAVNTSEILSQIASVNNTPNITIDLTPVLSAINATNISLTNEIVSGNVQVVAYVYDAINSTNISLHEALSQNTSAVLSAISGVSAEVQNTNSTLTTLINGVAFYFDGLFSVHDTNMANNFTQTNNLILAVNGTVGTCPTANTISNTVWSAPSRTLTEWSTVIPAIWGSEENNCKVKTTLPVQTVGNTENEPAGYKVGNTESGTNCGIGCRVSGFVNGIFGG